MRMKAIIYIFLLWAFPAALCADTSEILTIEQVRAIIDSSKLSYRISLLTMGAEDSIMRQSLRGGYTNWERVNQEYEAGDTTQLKRIVPQGFFQAIERMRTVVRRYKVSAAADKVLARLDQKGDSLDQRGRREVFLEAIALEPNYSYLLTGIGHTYLMEKDYEQALTWFRRAIEKNYFDYQAHWFMAYCCWELSTDPDPRGFKQRALREVVTALVLNRNDSLIKRDVDRICEFSYHAYTEFSIVPKCRISRNADTVRVEASKEWIGYALTKAVYMHEPFYPGIATNYSEVIGMYTHPYEGAVERNCLMNLVEVYYGTNTVDVFFGADHVDAYYGTDRKRKSDDKSILLAQKAIRDKEMFQYIMYEVWLRQDPIMIYYCPQDQVERVVDYVIKNHIVEN
jgi:tetratricopeptide (TPR) repeat protein